MTNSSPSSVMRGAMILTLAGLIGKVISAGYRVPLQNITGDLGFYIYQQVYPILGIALILALYGFPAAVSKLASEHKEVSLLTVVTVLFIICGFLFSIGYTQADEIAIIMGDPKLVPSLQAAFFVFLFVPFLSVLRGNFQGSGYMIPTAASQLTEQIIRVVGILLSAWFATRSGDFYHVGRGAAYASCAAALGALFVLIGYMRNHSRSFHWHWSRSITYVRTIVLYGMFISLNYTLLLSLQGIDALTLIPGFVKAGFTLEEAKVAKGVFDRGQPLIQLGTVLASSVALALIPAVTRERWSNQQERTLDSIISAVKFSFIISAAATLGLILLFPVINPLFFLDGKGTGALQLLMLVVVVSSLVMTTASVLQGLGYIRTTAFLILGGALLKWLCNLWLVPGFGLNGAAVSSVVAVTFVLFGNVVTLGREMPFASWSSLPFRQVTFSLLFMTVVVRGAMLLSPLFRGERLLLLFFTLAVVGTGALVYLLSLLRLGAFTKKEVEGLPMSKWWMRVLPKG